MDNKYLYMVLGGVFLFVWYWVGHQPHYATGDMLSQGYIISAVLMLALGAGNSDGTDAVTTPVNAVKGMVSTLICLVVAYIVTNLMYQFIVVGTGFNYMGLVKSISTLVASGVLMTITMSYFKKSSA